MIPRRFRRGFVDPDLNLRLAQHSNRRHTAIVRELDGSIPTAEKAIESETTESRGGSDQFRSHLYSHLGPSSRDMLGRHETLRC